MVEIAWGLIGTGKIVNTEVGPALARVARSRVAAVGSRNLASAERLAQSLGASTAYGSYELVLADPGIDAVYISLPNSLHAEWTIAALRAGKHVLCEKPLAMSAADARRVRTEATAAGRVAMEAFMWRFHPRIQKARQLVSDGTIGEPRLLRATFLHRSAALDSSDPRLNIRFQSSLGGGALADLGCYCVDALRLFAGHMPAEVVSRSTRADGVEVDTTATGELDFGGGVVGSFAASMELRGGSWLEIVGTEGSLTLEHPFRPAATGPNPVLTVTTAAGRSVQAFAPLSPYDLEVEAFIARVLGEPSESVTSDDSIENAMVLDAVRRSWTDDSASAVRLS